MSGTYGEPWTITQTGTDYVQKILDANGHTGMSHTQRRRAVACVNALEGIAHPEHVKELLETFRSVQVAHNALGSSGIDYEASCKRLFAAYWKCRLEKSEAR